MTKISLFTKDQVLLSSQKVKIAAGDIDSVTLAVAFDEKWDDFTSKVATFDNSNYNESIPDCLLVDNQCVVPWEALSVAGTLSIGIVGDATDGRRKTTTIVKMNILHGAKTGITTVSPSLDLYQQYIDAMVNQCDPVTSKLHADFSALMAEHDAVFSQRMAELDTYMQGDVLWENPDVSAGVGELTIPIDRTIYKRLHIEMAANESGAAFISDCICVHSNGRYRGKSHQGGDTRDIVVTDEAVIFDIYSSTATIIPARIIGYKY